LVLGSFCILCFALTNGANEVKIFSVSLSLTHANAFAMLPDVAFIACNAMGAIVDLSIGAADAIEYPILLFSKLLQNLLLSLDLCLEMTLRQAALASLELLTVFREICQLFLVQYTTGFSLLQPLLSSHHPRLAFFLKFHPFLLFLLGHDKLGLLLAIGFAGFFFLFLLLHFACDSAGPLGMCKFFEVE
jgi:hypothetical protein